MRFKSLLALSICLLSLQGCFFMDNEKPEQKGLNLPLDCLVDSDVKLRNYFQGRASNGSSDLVRVKSDIVGLLDCVGEALTFFLNHVRGKARDQNISTYNITERYSPSELRDFFENYLLNEGELPQDLIDQLMGLKVALLGGSIHNLTKRDIEKIQDILNQLKTPALLLASYMPLTLDHAKTKDVRWVKRLQEVLDRAGASIGETLSASTKQYSINDFKLLLKAFSSVYGSPETGYTPRFLLQHIQIFQALKVMFVGADRNQIHQSQWESLIHMGLRLFGLKIYIGFLGYESEQILKNKEITHSEIQKKHWALMLGGADQAIDLLITAVQNHEFDQQARDAFNHQAVISAQTAKNLLRAIAGTNIFPSTLKADKLVDSIMAIKATLSGGSRENISQRELEQIRSFLLQIQAPFLKLAGLFPLDGDWASHSTVEKLNEALAALSAFGDEFTIAMKAHGRDYHWKDLVNLFDAIRSISGKDSENGIIKFIVENPDLIMASKEIFAGSPSEIVLQSQWKELIEATIDVYSIFIILSHLNGYKDLPNGKRIVRYEKRSYGTALSYLNQVVHRIEVTLRDAVTRNPDSEISFDSIQRFISGLKNAELLGKNITAPVLYKTVVGAVRTIMRDPHSDLKPEQITGITLDSIDRAMKTWESWNQRQQALEYIFLKEAKNDPIQLFNVTIKRNNLVKRLDAMGDNYEDLKTMVRSYPRFFERNQSYISIDPANKPDGLSFHGLSELNWIRGLGIFLLEGFIKDKKRLMPNGMILIPELDAFYNWSRPLGIQLKWVDPRNNDSAKKRGREADLFMPNADGDGQVNRFEGVQLFVYLLKGKVRGKKNHLKLSQMCGESKNKENLDLFGYSLINPICYRDHFYDNVETFWKGLPGLIRFYKALSKERKIEFQKAFESASRSVGFDNKTKMEIADSEGYVILAYYLETVFYNFDQVSLLTAKADGILTWNELIPPTENDRNSRNWAFNVYDQVIINIANGINKKISVADAQKVFLYILMKGKISQSKTDIGLWYYTTTRSSIRVDRLQIMKMIAALKDPGAIQTKEVSAENVEGTNVSPGPKKIENQGMKNEIQNILKSMLEGAYDLSKSEGTKRNSKEQEKQRR